MKRLAGFIFAFCTLPVFAAQAASSLLQPVIAALPDIPLVISGDLQKRDAKNRIEHVYRVEMVLDWKADTPTARYTIRDAFGAPLQYLAITWDDPARPTYQYLEGNPLQSAAIPPLNQNILDTDLTWLDLSLSFLWWPGGEARGVADVRGRECNIVDVPAPEDYTADFDGVRLWLDSKIGIVMRAEGYDAEGTLIRRMDVKSFKKINNRWVIKDIDFQSFPQKTKTTLLVRNVIERDRFRAIGDEGFDGDAGEELPDVALLPVLDEEEIMPMDAKEEMRELSRRISALGESVRAETDPAQKAMLVEDLRALLKNVASRSEEKRQEYYAAMGEAAPDLDEVIDQHLRRILAGEHAPLPDIFQKFPAAKGSAPAE